MQSTSSTNQPILSASNVRKSYGHVKALRSGNLDVHAGEVVAIVGDNGAGKSTFLSCICGATKPDEGQILIDGLAIETGSIPAAMDAGLSVVYQDLAMAPHLSIAENIYLSTELHKSKLHKALGIIDRKSMQQKAAGFLSELGVDITNLGRSVNTLSGGQRQVVAVARAVSRASKVIVLDEPTAALGAKQSQIVLNTIKAARDKNLGVLLVSHDLPRVLEIADRIAVMRLGEISAHLDPKKTSVRDIVAVMLGEETALEGSH